MQNKGKGEGNVKGDEAIFVSRAYVGIQGAIRWSFVSGVMLMLGVLFLDKDIPLGIVLMLGSFFIWLHAHMIGVDFLFPEE